MKAGRPGCREVRIPSYGPRRETKRLARRCRTHAPQKNRAVSAAGARTKTDTGGRVEHTEAIGGTAVKELGIMAVTGLAPRAEGGRSEKAQATVYQKHRTLPSRKAKYRV